VEEIGLDLLELAEDVCERLGQGRNQGADDRVEAIDVAVRLDACVVFGTRSPLNRLVFPDHRIPCRFSSSI
jgi:hypothetical protein